MGLTGVMALTLGVATASASSDPTLVNATVITRQGSYTATVHLSDLEGQPPYAGPTGDDAMDEYDGPGQPAQSAQLAEDDFPDGQGTWPVSSVALAAEQNALGQTEPAGEVSSIVVANADGSLQSPLNPADLATPSDFAMTDESPVITDLGGYEYYYRPWRGGSDANAPDTIGPNALNSANEDNPVNLQVFLADSLRVTVSAPATTATPGATLTFTSSSSAPAADPVLYAWTEDGTIAGARSSQTLSFPNAGEFTVAVEVTDPRTGASGGDEVVVNVSSSAAPSTTQGAASTLPVGGTGSAASGSSQSNGTTPGGSAGTQSTPAQSGPAGTQTHPAGADATHPAAGTSRTHPAAGADATHPAAGTSRTHPAAGTSRTHPAAGTSTPAPASSVPTQAASETSRGHPASSTGGVTGAPQTRATTPAAGRAASSGVARSGHPTVTAPSTYRPRPANEPVRAQAHPRLVSGLLVSDIIGVSGLATASAASGADGQPPGLARSAQHSVLAAWAAGLSALMLLGLGVGWELSGRRGVPRWARSPTA